MWRIILWVVYAVICGGTFATYVNTVGDPPKPQFMADRPFITFVVLFLLSQLVPAIDLVIRRKRIETVSAVYFGLLIGVLLSYLLATALGPVVGEDFKPLVIIVATVTLPYICISLLLQTKDDFRFIIPYVEFSRELKGGTPLVLDSSALIDGRIADVVDTNILDSEIIVPKFVLHEVQDIADSGDKMRRTRGRRGLEVLAKLQNNPKTDIRVYESKHDDSRENSVDQKLVELAKQLNGRVVTSDFNLNKVASVQGVPVVNLNDVANSLKPRYLPGEKLRIKVIKEGESHGQGVGYLDDGTMVICEQASHLIGNEIDVTVTSVLQSSAGRMIFGRTESH